jgi:hypothetical protein
MRARLLETDILVYKELLNQWSETEKSIMSKKLNKKMGLHKPLLDRKISRLMLYCCLLFGCFQCQLLEKKPFFVGKYESGAVKLEVFNGDNNSYYVRKYFESGKLMHEYGATDTIYQGWSLRYHENGIMQSKAFMRDGKVDGGRLTYYSNGQIKCLDNCKLGMQDGFATYYDSLGRMEEVTFFVNDTPRYSRTCEYDSLGHYTKVNEEYNPKIVLSTDEIFVGKEFSASLDFELPKEYFNLDKISISIDIAKGEKVNGQYVLFDKPKIAPKYDFELACIVGEPGDKLIVAKVYDTVTKEPLGENFIEYKIFVKKQ